MNWLKQTPDSPLFPDVLWNRPENRRHAGKLLIIGGHAQSFSAVSEAYGAAQKAGAGTVRVLVPQKLQPTLKTIFPEADYAASNDIGSFSRQALAEFLEASEWADAVLLAGDFGRNSETALLLEDFLKKYAGKLALTGDSLDYFMNNPRAVTSRPNTLIIAALSQLQKLAAPHLIQQNADLAQVAEQLAGWASSDNLLIITVHSGQIIIAGGSRVSTTPSVLSWPVPDLASLGAVWWLQQPEKPFEALTTAAHCLGL
ncbi:MAG TPA: hypothetical protein VFJ84_03385 [Candidatus Saccharimonadales bacterium]|nr:hypothetical protein [Candidatus Saccharimonadales bacterium]